MWPRLRWYLGILLGAAAFRWLIMLRCYRLPDSDQVMVGLMARHVLLGEMPIFYWGQPYDGTLETYLTAAVFRLFGQSYEALHVAPLAFSLLFLGAAMWLAECLYGARTAIVSGLILAVGPALLLRYSVEPGYNYLQAMAFATLALALLVPLGAGGGWWRLPAASFCLGLALWAQPLGVVYLPSLLLILAPPALAAWQDLGERGRLLLALGVASVALALALLPALVYNLHHNAATLRFLVGRPTHLPLDLAEKVRRLLLWGSPVLLGLLPPSVNSAVSKHLLQRHPWLDPLALALLALGMGLLLRPLRAVPVRLRCWPRGDAALLLLGLTTIGSYLGSTWSSSSWSATDPRYLLPLYTLMPMVARSLVGTAASPRWLARTGTAMLIWLCGALLVTSVGQREGDLGPLAGRLAADGTRVVYGNYWDVYRLAFASDERLLPVVVTPDRELGLNRYRPYLRRAATARPGAWVVGRGSPLDSALHTCFITHRIRYLRFAYGQDASLTVYTRLAAPWICLAGVPLS